MTREIYRTCVACGREFHFRQFHAGFCKACNARHEAEYDDDDIDVQPDPVEQSDKTYNGTEVDMEGTDYD